jgi:hypothetical protein
MILTREELMKPRYKVIADFPASSYLIGEVKTWEPIHQDPAEWAAFYEQYPAIFRRMYWWEDRTIDTLPLFVRYIGYGSRKEAIAEVKEWVIGRDGGVYFKGEGRLCRYLDGPTDLPATREEYLAQQTSSSSSDKSHE